MQRPRNIPKMIKLCNFTNAYRINENHAHFREITKFWTYPCNNFLLAHSTLKVLALLPRTAFLNVTLSNPFLATVVRNILTAVSSINVVQLGLARSRGRLTCATDPYRSFKRLSRRLRLWRYITRLTQVW